MSTLNPLLRAQLLACHQLPAALHRVAYAQAVATGDDALVKVLVARLDAPADLRAVYRGRTETELRATYLCRPDVTKAEARELIAGERRAQVLSTVLEGTDTTPEVRAVVAETFLAKPTATLAKALLLHGLPLPAPVAAEIVAVLGTRERTLPSWARTTLRIVASELPAQLVADVAGRVTDVSVLARLLGVPGLSADERIALLEAAVGPDVDAAEPRWDEMELAILLQGATDAEELAEPVRQWVLAAAGRLSPARRDIVRQQLAGPRPQRPAIGRYVAAGDPAEAGTGGTAGGQQHDDGPLSAHVRGLTGQQRRTYARDGADTGLLAALVELAEATSDTEVAVRLLANPAVPAVARGRLLDVVDQGRRYWRTSTLVDAVRAHPDDTELAARAYRIEPATLVSELGFAPLGGAAGVAALVADLTAVPNGPTAERPELSRDRRNARNGLLAVLAHPDTPTEVLLDLPWSTIHAQVRSYAARAAADGTVTPETCDLTRVLDVLADAEQRLLGNSAARWEVFDALADSFPGTAAELLETACALAPAPAEADGTTGEPTDDRAA